MDTGFKVWHCRYDESGRMGFFQEYRCIVIAEIKSKALGMALMEFPGSNASDWSAEEIPTDREGVHWISERSS